MDESIVKESPIIVREALIPYGMAMLNMLAPTLAAYEILWPSPFIFLVAVSLIIVGVPCSILFRRKGFNRIALNLITTLPLLVLTWALVHNHPGLQVDWSNPLESIIANASSPEQFEGLLYLFILLAAGRAFLLVTSRELMQTPLPGISIFLLTSITIEHTTIYLLFCLLLLLFSSIYLFSHEFSQQWFPQQPPLRVQQRLLAWSGWFSLIIFPLIVILGGILQSFNMYSAIAMRSGRNAPHFRLPNLFGREVGLAFSPTVDVGGSDWPSGKQQIMRVSVDEKAPGTLLWRAGTYSVYLDGQWRADLSRPHGFPRDEGWQRDDRVQLLSSNPAVKLEIDPKGSSSDPAIQQAAEEIPEFPTPDFVVTQQFEVRARSLGHHGTPIYAAFQAYQVSSKNRDFLRLGVRNDGSIFLPGMTYRDEIGLYEVKSLVKPEPTTTSFALKGVVELSRGERERYLQIPWGNLHLRDGKEGPTTEKVRKLALDALAANKLQPVTPKSEHYEYEAARQLAYYLSQNYRYTLKPSPPPPGVDPTLDFLFTQKQGYCNYFSTSMIMLCRSLGIPARFVVGFATGDRVETPANEEPGMAGEGKIIYQVNSEHAHSWVEVFLPNYGWYIIDPTAGSTEVPTFWGKSWDIITEMATIVKNTVAGWIAAFRENPRLRAYAHLTLGILLVLIAVLIVVKRERPPSLPRRPLTPAQARAVVLASYRRMLRWLDRWGIVKPEHLTAGEFERRFRAINQPMGEIVCKLTDLYVQAQYSEFSPGDSEGRQAILLLRQLWELGRLERKRLVDLQSSGV